VQSTASLAPSNVTVNNNAASESGRSPSLPVELNGVSMSINGAACGLFSVSPTAISFVVPIGLAPNSGAASYPVVINNNGTVIRGLVVIVAAQPDIFSSTNGAGGRAVVCNVTNPSTPGCLVEPFKITSDDGTGTLVPTKLEIHLTGVRNNVAGTITATIGATAITAAQNMSTDLPGFDEVDIILPANVNTGPNLTLVITVGTATSRQTATAPLIRIDP